MPVPISHRLYKKNCCFNISAWSLDALSFEQKIIFHILRLINTKMICDLN